LKATLGAALPILSTAVGVSIFLAVLAVIPPSALRGAPITEFIAPRRRELTLVSVSIAFSTAIAIAVVFWAL
jgi:hypothetical protein